MVRGRKKPPVQLRAVGRLEANIVEGFSPLAFERVQHLIRMIDLAVLEPPEKHGQKMLYRGKTESLDFQELINLSRLASAFADGPCKAVRFAVRTVKLDPEIGGFGEKMRG